MPPAAKRRKSSVLEAEEITWDPLARQEYLTGFHKRKQQRIQHAQKTAAEKERLQRIQDRKQIREQRRKELDRHVQQVNEAVKSAERSFADSVNDDDDDDDDDGDVEDSALGTGPDESEGEVTNAHEDEFMDEDKFTTVTVEPMMDHSDTSFTMQEERTLTPSWNFPRRKPSVGKAAKSRQKPFRYETKAERKIERLQHGIKKARAAQSRREQH